MKKNKFILLILVMFLFSGCSVKYNLSINEDLSVNEDISASENSISLKTKTGQDPEVAATSLYKLYKIDGVKYDISTVSEDGNTTTTVSSSFSSLDEYAEKFKSDIVKEVNITKKGSLITLEYKQDVPLSSYASRTLMYDMIEVDLDIPFKVTKNNADAVKGNTYIWYIKKDEDLKNIKITFNKDETETSKKFNILGFLEVKVQYSVLLIVGIIVVVLAIVGIVYMNNKKNNRF